MNIVNNFETTRKLLDLPKLLEHYKIKKLKVTYKDTKGIEKTLDVPMSLDLFVKLKTWIAYDEQLRELYISQNIRQENHWISTLLDDQKYNRINVEDFIYDRQI